MEDEARGRLDVPGGGLLDAAAPVLQILGQERPGGHDFARTKGLTFDWECAISHKLQK